MDESLLLAELATDVDRAFEGLIRAQGDRIYSIALRMLGKPADAEDIAQETFVRAYRALDGWDPARIRDLRLGAWLATICVNLVRNRARRGRRPRTTGLTFLDEMDHPSGSPADTPHDRLAQQLTAEAWANRLLRVPERYRAPIVLRHVDGLGYDEIAAALGRPEGTVKAQVHRGLALLRAVLEAEGDDNLADDPLLEPATATNMTSPNTAQLGSQGPRSLRPQEILR